MRDKFTISCLISSNRMKELLLLFAYSTASDIYTEVSSVVVYANPPSSIVKSAFPVAFEISVTRIFPCLPFDEITLKTSPTEFPRPPSVISIPEREPIVIGASFKFPSSVIISFATKVPRTSDR